MISLLLLFSTTGTCQLPVPTKPASLGHAQTECMPALITRLETVPTSFSGVTPEFNYEVWRDNGNRWSRERYNAVRPPTKALQIPMQIARLQLGDEPCSRRPWDSIYQERSDFVSRGYLIGEVVGYRVIGRDVRGVYTDSIGDGYWGQAKTRHETQVEYFAVIDALPFSVLRAKSIEELERTVVSRFDAYVEVISMLHDDFPLNVPRDWSTQYPAAAQLRLLLDLPDLQPVSVPW